MNATQLKVRGHNYDYFLDYKNGSSYICHIAFCSFVFILFLSLALHTKHKFI